MGRRLVVKGKVKAEFATIETTYDTELGYSIEAEEAGLDQWNPTPHPGWAKLMKDVDQERKERIEEALVRGDDLL